MRIEKSILLALLVANASCFAQTDIIVAPSESIAGKTQTEWSRAWWQWAGSFQRNESPVADRSGDKCGSKQAGPVWFLAGTYGTQRTTRVCKIPKGKYLFFPLINYVVMPTERSDRNCLEKIATAAEITNDPAMLVLDVDNTKVEDLISYRQATKVCFDMGALTAEKFRIFPSAANGYYVMLRPLKSGTHVLNFGGALPRMLQAVTYTLTVE